MLLPLPARCPALTVPERTSCFVHHGSSLPFLSLSAIPDSRTCSVRSDLCDGGEPLHRCQHLPLFLPNGTFCEWNSFYGGRPNFINMIPLTYVNGKLVAYVQPSCQPRPLRGILSSSDHHLEHFIKIKRGAVQSSGTCLVSVRARTSLRRCVCRLPAHRVCHLSIWVPFHPRYGPSLHEC
jgi:hypothetical protein